MFSHSVVSEFLQPMECSTPGLSYTISQSLLKLMSTELLMPSNHLILCHPLLLLPSIFPSIRVFSSVENSTYALFSLTWLFRKPNKMGSQKSAHLLAGLRGEGLIVSQIPSNSGFQEADTPILREALRGQGDNPTF